MILRVIGLLGLISCFSQTAFAQSPYLVGYWQNWDTGSSPYISLDQLDSRYNVVNLSFAIPGVGNDYDMTFPLCCGETTAGLISKIQILQANGTIVNISIGGATDPVHLTNISERDIFISSMNTIINTYGFDGLDIDLEGSSLSISAGSTIANPTDTSVLLFIEAVQQIMADYQNNFSKKMFLSAAPETAFVQGGQSSWGGIWGAYLPVLDALRDDMDLLHVQLYNSGSMYGIDGNIYAQSTADFIISQTEAVIAGFNTNGGFFAGFSPEKVAIALPACPSAAGGGFTNVSIVKNAIDYLRGNASQPNTYTLQGGPYPSLGGMMTWSVNWDAVNTCNSSAYEYASNFEDIFLSETCFQPDLGIDISACGLNFPYTLNSNTPTNPDVTFTWTNLSTGQVLISNNPTATNLSINETGIYQVQRDSLTCSRIDVIEVLEDLPIPILPTSLSLCNILPEAISVSNEGSFPIGTAWKWRKDGELLINEMNSSFSDIRSAGTYQVIATFANCTASSSTIVSSDLPDPLDACGVVSEQLILGISTNSAGSFEWYETPSGGTQLGTGTTFTTPPLNETTTYYVEDASSIGSATTGPTVTNNGLGNLQNWFNPTELTFDATTTFVLKSLSIYPLIWCGTHTVSFEIRDNNGSLLPNGNQLFIITGDNDCGAVDNTPVPVTLSNGGVTISQGMDYKIVVTSTVGVNHWSGNVAYPMDYNPYFTITGSNVNGTYLAIHDWEVGGASCARLPVIAQIDANCSNVCDTDLVLNDNPILDGIYQTNQTISSSGTIDANTTVQFKVGNCIELNTNFSIEEGAIFSAEIEPCDN